MTERRARPAFMRRLLDTKTLDEMVNEIRNVEPLDIFTEKQVADLELHIKNMANDACSNVEGANAKTECVINWFKHNAVIDSIN